MVCRYSYLGYGSFYLKVRRQLEYTIAASKGITMAKPPGTIEAVKEIYRNNGFAGLYTGFRLHFGTLNESLINGGILLIFLIVRDTAGTALYFLEYDGMRHLLGRQRSGEQGPTPSWLPIHPSLVPFVCGSLSGVCIRYLCGNLGVLNKECS